MDARTEALAALADAGDSPLMRSFPQGAVFTWDYDLRYLSAGGYGLADVGLSREMLEGRTIFEAFAPETALAIEPMYRAALCGESTTIDVPYEGHVFSQHLSPVHDRDGNIVAGMGFTQDVTHVRAAENALRESEERSRLSFENAPIGQALVELDGRWRHVNAAVSRLTGYTEAELLAMTFQDITHPDDLDADLAHLEQLVAGTISSYEMEKRYITATGATVWVLLAVSMVRSAEGTPLYFIAQIQDLTERRRNETRFKGLLEAAPDALLGIDTRGLIQLVNTQAEQLFGYPRGELLGQPIETLVPDGARSAHPAHRARYFSNPQVRPMGAGADLSGRRKDGSEFPAEISLSSIETEEGLLVTAAVRDVSERRAFEAVVARARDLAEQAAGREREFLANMSHEIRTPMNAVIGMTSLLLDTTLDDQQRDYVETVRTSGEHLLTIINDILDYAKIDSGKLVLEKMAFDVRPWLRDTLDLIAAQAQEKGLELICDVDPRTPAMVTGDPGRLRQILVNLLSNAVKFTQEGEVIARVCHGGGRLLITVSDTGAGIAPERIEGLFEPFTQADSSTTRVYGGTGLGLAISRHLASVMGGEITMDSTPDVGTTVRVTVPVDTVVAVTVAPDATPMHGPLAGRRILVVDDNAASRSMLQTWSTRHQLTCVSASSAEQALRIVRDDQDFAFAVIDLLMPGMNGAELGLLLRARLPAARLILLSCAGPARGILPGAQQFDAVVAKPLDQMRLFDLLGTLLVTGTSPELPRIARSSAFSLPATTRSLSILIVEDNAVNQKVAQHLLSRFGFRSDVAASGLEAIAALEQRDYDLVLMDVQMPGTDGLEATRLIRSRWPQRPVQIVAMTANVAAEDVRRCYAAGMDDFLGKPIVVPALARILGAFTGPAPTPPVMARADEDPAEGLPRQVGPGVMQC
ncbi:MAG: PAS domain S-box protein [Sporichthyaceae bacterium]